MVPMTTDEYRRPDTDRLRGAVCHSIMLLGDTARYRVTLGDGTAAECSHDENGPVLHLTTWESPGPYTHRRVTDYLDLGERDELRLLALAHRFEHAGTLPWTHARQEWDEVAWLGDSVTFPWGQGGDWSTITVGWHGDPVPFDEDPPDPYGMRA